MRCKYGLMELAGTAVDPANTGDTGSEASHGSTADQDGMELEEGYETLQRAVPARGNNGAGDEARGHFERSCAPNACG